MEFSRVGEHTIRCVISEQEIEEMGYSLEDLMTNSEKSQTFMNQIFDMAEQEFQMNFDLGIRTVRADFLPDILWFLICCKGSALQKLKNLY